MDISNYNSIYELSAALCSALSGLVFISDFILARLKHVFDRVKENISQQATEVSILHSQIMLFYELYERKNSGLIIWKNLTFEQVIDKSSNFVKWLNRYDSLVDSKHEALVNRRRIIALFVQTFVFNCIFIIAGGFQQDYIVCETQLQSFLFYFILLTIFSQAISTRIISNTSKSFLLISILFSLMTLGLAIALTMIFCLYWENHLSLIITSILMLPISITIAISRLVWWWPIEYKMRRNVQKYTKFYQDVAAILTRIKEN